MNIDEEIKELETKLAILKSQKNENIIKNNDITSIDLYDYSSDNTKIFENFEMFFDFLKKKMKSTEKIIIDYKMNGSYYNKEFAIINNDSVKEILNILTDLDALSLYSMDFGIVNKKEELKFSIFLHSEFLDTLTEAIECKTIKNIPINQETYWSIFDKSKSYRITSRSNNNE